MEPAKTHGIYTVLTSSASETVVFAAFCNTTLYTTTLIVLLLQKQQQLLLLLPLLRTTTYYYVLLRTTTYYYVLLRTTTYFVYVLLRTSYTYYYVLRIRTTTYYYVLLRTTTYYYVRLRTTTYYYVLLRTTYTYYVLLRTTTYYVLRTTYYYVLRIRTTYMYYVYVLRIRIRTTYYYVLLRATTYYYVLLLLLRTTTYYYVRLRTTMYHYVLLRTTTYYVYVLRTTTYYYVLRIRTTYYVLLRTTYTCVYVISLFAYTIKMTCRPCLDTYIHTYKQTINQYKQIVIIHKSIETYSYTYTWLQMVRPPQPTHRGGAGTLCVHVVSLCADTKTMTCRPCLDTYIHTYKQTINQYKQIVIIHKSIETYSYTYTWLQMVRPPQPTHRGGAGTLCVHVVSLCADTKTMTCRPCLDTYIHTYKQTINQYKQIVIIHKSIETYSYTYTWLQMVRPPQPTHRGGWEHYVYM